MNANKRQCKEDLIYKDEVYRIVGAAMNVSNNLGCGFLEAVYQEVLVLYLSNGWYYLHFMDRAIRDGVPLKRQRGCLGP